MTERDIQNLAIEAYDGWNGWYYRWHWPDLMVPRVTKIRAEAIAQAHAMREKVEDLQQRIRKCEQVAQAAQEWLEDNGEAV